MRRTNEGVDEEVDLTSDETEIRRAQPNISLSTKDIGVVQEELLSLRRRELPVEVVAPVAVGTRNEDSGDKEQQEDLAKDEILKEVEISGDLREEEK